MADPNNNLIAPEEDAVTRFAKKWGIDAATTNSAPPKLMFPERQDPIADVSTNQPPQSADPAIQRFLAKWGDTGSQTGNVNAPPSTIMASPQMTPTERMGRTDEAGNLIPIDFNATDPDLGDYGRFAQQRDPESKLELLNKLYPEKKARILESGEIALQIIDSKTGKPKEVMLNPSGVDSSDLIDLAAQAPEIAAGIATAIATRGRGFLKTVGQIVASSLAASGTGAVKDMAVRGIEGLSPRPGEIIESRGEEALLDMFVQGGMGAAGKALRIGSPFAKEINRGSMEFDLLQGQKFMKDVFGENFKLTPGQITGSPALKAVEASHTPLPGSRTVMGNIKAGNEAAIGRIQKRAVGAATPEEQIGEQAIGTIRREIVEPLEGALTEARTLAESKGQSRLTKLLDDAIGVPSGARITPTMAGVKTLEEFDAKLAQAKQRVDDAYAQVNALPGGTGDVLSGTPASNAAAEIRKELPTVIRKAKRPTGIVGPSGKEITREVTETEVLKSGVPDGLLKALDDLEGLKGGKVSLQTLTNMKRAAYDEIAKTEALPGVKDRWFNKIAKAYDRGIQEGIEETGDPALKQALTNAKEVYKKELLPFDRPGVRELAKTEFDTGRLAPEQIIDRLFSGSKPVENFRILKETLGENNPAFRILKRAWADTKLASVTDPVTGSVDVDGLKRIMDKMRVDTPELAEEMFGKNHMQIASTLSYLKRFKDMKNMDETELKVLTSLPNPSKADLETIIKMQDNRDKAYVNEIFRDVADGLPISSRLKPTEFVKRISNTTTPTKQVKEVLDVLAKENPETREAVATAQFYRLLDQASVREATTASKSIAGEPMNLSPTKLAEALGRKGSPERLRNEMLLGEGSAPGTSGKASRLEVLENLVKLTAPSEAQTARAFSSMGGIAAGNAVHEMTRNPLKYLTGYARNMMLSIFYTTEISTKIISNRALGPAETAVIANTLIASEPFVRRATEAFGPDAAQSMIAEAKSSIDRWVEELRVQMEPQIRERQALQQGLQGQRRLNIQAQ